MAQVFLGMSGGVDSSAAAVLLLERGYCVHGLHLSLLNTLPLPENCPPEDGSDARAVAQALELPFHDLDLSERFRQTVAAYFIREYEAGRTPNPCVFCNREIKFGAMWDAAQALGADYLATGHYANVARDPVSGRYLLRRGADRAKDQSYFLCRLTQEQLSHTLFPLGGLTKPQVRELAEARGLPTARKRDSQDICFVPDGDYAGLIARCVGHDSPVGPFLGPDGLGHNEELFTMEAVAGDWNWISIPTLTAPMEFTMKLRYSQKESPAIAEPLADGRVRLRFREAQRAVTPGQFAVLYDGENVVGGGVIEK